MVLVFATVVFAGAVVNGAKSRMEQFMTNTPNKVNDHANQTSPTHSDDQFDVQGEATACDDLTKDQNKPTLIEDGNCGNQVGCFESYSSEDFFQDPDERLALSNHGNMMNTSSNMDETETKGTFKNHGKSQSLQCIPSCWTHDNSNAAASGTVKLSKSVHDMASQKNSSKNDKDASWHTKPTITPTCDESLDVNQQDLQTAYNESNQTKEDGSTDQEQAIKSPSYRASLQPEVIQVCNQQVSVPKRQRPKTLKVELEEAERNIIDDAGETTTSAQEDCPEPVQDNITVDYTTSDDRLNVAIPTISTAPEHRDTITSESSSDTEDLTSKSGLSEKDSERPTEHATVNIPMEAGSPQSRTDMEESPNGYQGTGNAGENQIDESTKGSYSDVGLIKSTKCNDTPKIETEPVTCERLRDKKESPTASLSNTESNSNVNQINLHTAASAFTQSGDSVNDRRDDRTTDSTANCLEDTHRSISATGDSGKQRESKLESVRIDEAPSKESALNTKPKAIKRRSRKILEDAILLQMQSPSVLPVEQSDQGDVQIDDQTNSSDISNETVEDPNSVQTDPHQSSDDTPDDDPDDSKVDCKPIDTNSVNEMEIMPSTVVTNDDKSEASDIHQDTDGVTNSIQIYPQSSSGTPNNQQTDCIATDITLSNELEILEDLQSITPSDTQEACTIDVETKTREVYHEKVEDLILFQSRIDQQASSVTLAIYDHDDHGIQTDVKINSTGSSSNDAHPRLAGPKSSELPEQESEVIIETGEADTDGELTDPYPTKKDEQPNTDQHGEGQTDVECDPKQMIVDSDVDSIYQKPAIDVTCSKAIFFEVTSNNMDDVVRRFETLGATSGNGSSHATNIDAVHCEAEYRSSPDVGEFRCGTKTVIEAPYPEGPRPSTSEHPSQDTSLRAFVCEGLRSLFGKSKHRGLSSNAQQITQPDRKSLPYMDMESPDINNAPDLQFSSKLQPRSAGLDDNDAIVMYAGKEARQRKIQQRRRMRDRISRAEAELASITEEIRRAEKRLSELAEDVERAMGEHEASEQAMDEEEELNLEAILHCCRAEEDVKKLESHGRGIELNLQSLKRREWKTDIMLRAARGEIKLLDHRIDKEKVLQKEQRDKKLEDKHRNYRSTALQVNALFAIIILQIVLALIIALWRM